MCFNLIPPLTFDLFSVRFSIFHFFPIDFEFLVHYTEINWRQTRIPQHQTETVTLRKCQQEGVLKDGRIVDVLLPQTIHQCVGEAQCAKSRILRRNVLGRLRQEKLFETGTIYNDHRTKRQLLWLWRTRVLKKIIVHHRLTWRQLSAMINASRCTSKDSSFPVTGSPPHGVALRPKIKEPFSPIKSPINQSIDWSIDRWTLKYKSGQKLSAKAIS